MSQSDRPLREALEAALVANPDDIAAHSAYADLLTEQGDPRGEFIQVQLALEDSLRSPDERAQLQQRESILWNDHQRDFLGPLAPYFLGSGDFPDSQAPWIGDSEVRFVRGWVDVLHIPILSAGCAAALAQAPQVRLLRSLMIRDLDDPAFYSDAREDREYPGFEPLNNVPYLTNVRCFEYGYRYRGQNEDYTYNSSQTHCSYPWIVAKMPRLEELCVNGSSFMNADFFFKLEAPWLRLMQFALGQECPLEILAANRAMSNLESLLLHPQNLDDGENRPPYITLEGVRALLDSPHLKNLKELRLHMTEIGDRGCDAVVHSGILRRLRWLDLSYGCITDEGARILATCPDLKNLKRLDLQQNALSDQGIGILQSVGIDVRADRNEQHDADDRQYLYEGDIE